MMSENKKVCSKGLNSVWINNENGDVRICGWTSYFIGNLVDSTIEELWHGEKAEAFRAAMLDGSYRFCMKEKCPFCANETLEEKLVDYEVPEYPTQVSLSYEWQCNYVCKFCRSEHFLPKKMENIPKIEKEVLKILPHLQILSTNGAGEIFCSPSILKILETAKMNSDLSIEIETNGSLFNEKNWDRIKRIGDHHLRVFVTVHSFDEDTYQYLSGTKLPISNIMHNLHFISDLRDKEIINSLEIATVVCEKNYKELPQFVKTCLQEFSMDSIRLRFYEPYGVGDRAMEWFYDVRNPLHPYNKDFKKVMLDPIFNNEKVWRWQGELDAPSRENPYQTEFRNFHTLARLYNLSRHPKELQKYFHERNLGKIALYGASETGEAYLSLLNESLGLGIDTIFDTNCRYKGGENFDVIYPSEDRIHEYDTIIIVQMTYAPLMKEWLERLRFNGNILDITQIVDEICPTCC